MSFPINAAAFIALVSVCGLISTYFTLREIEEINRKLPQEKQIEYAFMYPGKMGKIALEYKRLCPQGSLNRWRLVFQAAGIFFLVLTALALGFFR
jgi:hypothetical protein